MKYTHILWDWNGTLLDDVGISIECVNILLKKLSLSPTNLEEYYEMMDIPMKRYYDNLFSSRGASVHYEFCTENFQQNYPALIEQASLMCGAKEILQYFRKLGAQQYIVSSFEQKRLQSYVKHFGIDDFFEKISGDKDIHVGNKSQRALEIVGQTEKKHILYVGDSKADYQTAKDIGCDCILICKGHQPREKLDKFGCPVIDSLLEIKNICAK